MTTYTCPHHPEIRSSVPGVCPTCGGMKLVPVEVTSDVPPAPDRPGIAQYLPLLVIAGLIALASTVAAWDGAGVPPRIFMAHFMAGFFLVFSGFKLIDIAGFAKGYSKYDLFAMQWKGYGYVYPFLELALGLLYLRMPEDSRLHIATLALMTFSGVGVAVKIAKHEKFQCACLGTFIKVPLTAVTLVEDFGMAAMAGLMLLM